MSTSEILKAGWLSGREMRLARRAEHRRHTTFGLLAGDHRGGRLGG